MARDDGGTATGRVHWQRKDGDAAGNNLTNDIGLDPTLNTKWTCSIYDSSFFYNPKMEEFRNAKPIKYPFFLTPNKHFIGHLVYSTNITVPEPWKRQERRPLH